MELAIGLIIGVLGLAVGFWGLLYAHKSYAIARRAPVVRVACMDMKSEAIITSISLSRQSLELKDDGYSSPIDVPILVKNIGVLSARNIQLNVRYPGAFQVRSSGDRILDEQSNILKNNILVAHKLPDLQPQAQVLIKDSIRVCKEFFEGLPVDTKVKTEDNIPVVVKLNVYFSLIIECILLCDGCLPTYSRIEIINADKEGRDVKAEK